MFWSTKLEEWKKGVPLIYPKKIKRRFYYETTPIYKDKDSKYENKFIENSYLDSMEQDYKSFETYINQSKDKYAICFYNLSKTTYLVIPRPKRGKIFTTIKDFIDNASKTQQKFFWKKAYNCIIDFLKEHEKIYISTHGTGVPFFHLRIESDPKYYITKSYIDT